MYAKIKYRSRTDIVRILHPLPPLKMAELAETRLISDVASDAPQLLPADLVGTADYRPGGYEHPRSDHTNVHTYRTYISKQSKQRLRVKFCETHHDCKCCDSIGGASIGADVGPSAYMTEALVGVLCLKVVL